MKNKNKKVVGIYLDLAVWRKLNLAAEKNRRSMSAEAAIRLESSFHENKKGV